MCILFLSHQFIGTRQGEAFQLSLVADRGHIVNPPSRKKAPTSSLGFDVSAKITDFFLSHQCSLVIAIHVYCHLVLVRFAKFASTACMLL